MPAPLLFADVVAADPGSWTGMVSIVATAVLGYLGNELRVQVRELRKDLKGCEEKHQAAEETIAGLKRQNGDQQQQLNDHKQTTADLTAKVSRLVGQLRGFGVTDTDEYTPLAPKDG